jgi:hypothetical protein
MRRRTSVQSQAAEQELEATQVLKQPPALEPAATDDLSVAEIQNRSNSLPAVDAPIYNFSEPALSYKIDYSDKSQWFVSEDAGATKRPSGLAAVTGTPIDLQLQVSEATNPSGFYTHDFRLRLAFFNEEGVLCELNLSAINYNPTTREYYVSSPARSLTGALLAISDSEEDMEVFCSGARFGILPGRGRGVFVETFLTYKDGWIPFSSANATKRAPTDVHGFLQTLDHIKANFRCAGLLATAQAVSGDFSAFIGNTVDV